MAKRKGTRADALRTAVDQTLHAAAGQAQLTRDRAQEIVDELSHTATRVRELLDDLRPPSGDEIRSVREQLQALERRVAKLEGRGKPAGKAKRSDKGSAKGAARGSGTGAAKGAARGSGTRAAKGG